MPRTMITRRGALLGAAALAARPAAAQGTVALLNVSYDPTREFYRDFGSAFAAHWRAQTGQTVRISTSRRLRAAGAGGDRRTDGRRRYPRPRLRRRCDLR